MGSKRKKLNELNTENKKKVLDLTDKGVSEQLLCSLVWQSQPLGTLTKTGMRY
jgi:hypothetical protein